MSSLAQRRPAAGDDYLELCRGVLRLTKVDLSQYKRPQMERRIRAFARRHGLERLDDYLELLAHDESERNAFLDRMTINVSQLWRNPGQWDLLRKTILPELAATAGRLRIWSAGCSYGAEAYSLAAVALEAIPDARIEVLGTDIDRRVVERARAGMFDREDTRAVPPASLERWFQPEGEWWRANDELRRRVRFEVGDLLQSPVPPAAFDLVLCRNVVIYFKEDVRDRLHERLASSLRPGGFLMVGSTERINASASIGLETAHPFTYRRA